METKVKSVSSKIANVLVVIIGILILIVAISAISSSVKGYSNFFGYTVYAVKTDSMSGENEDSFNKGDLIIVKVLESEEEKASPEVGDIITFFDMIDGKRQLNSHRIIYKRSNGGVVEYTTKGDKEGLDQDTSPVYSEHVVGVYSSKVRALGNIVLFVQSPAGFLVLIVIPSLLVVAYCVYLLIKNIKAYNEEKKTDDYDKLREQILKELQGQNSAKDGAPPQENPQGENKDGPQG